MWKKEPTHPAVSLPNALQKVTLLREAFESADIELAEAFACWGCKPHSQEGSDLVDTLESYGLIRCLDSDGERLLRISHTTKRDYLDEQATREQRSRAIQRFALKPAIYQVLWERWAFDLSRDGEIERFLEKDIGYSARTSQRLVRDYRATIELARTHGLRVSRVNRGNTVVENTGDDLEYSYPLSAGYRELSDDMHTNFEIEEDVDVTLEAGMTDLEFQFDDSDKDEKPPDHFTGERVLPANTRSTRVSAYGVTMLQEIGKFQVSSDRKIYLMADGPVNRGDLESLLAQLTLKLEIGDIDEDEQS
jgi:hypothetical protein